MKILEEFSREYEILKEDVDRGVRVYKIRGVMGRANYPNKNRRLYPIDVMQESVNSVQESIQANRFLGELDHPSCVGVSDFSILGKEGWKDFVECKVGDEVATLNEDGQIVYQKIEHITDEYWKGDIYHFFGRNIDSKFTSTHRHYLEDRYGNTVVATTKEIFENRTKFNKHKIIKLGNWVGEDKEKIKVGNLEIESKNFMAFMGFYLSEGFTSKKRNLVSISQNEGKTADEFREVLKNLPFSFKEYSTKNRDNVNIRFIINNPDLWIYLSKIGNCYVKYIPYELKQLSPNLLEELLEWFIKGDGRDQRGMNGGNRANVFSVSKRLVEDLHEIVIKIGGSGNWTEHNSTEDYMFADHLIEAENKSALYQLNISTTKGIYLDERFLKIEKEEHDGNVYCITVPNGNFFMKQNNKTFLTGNSPKINMDKISHKVISLTMNEDGVVLGEMLPAGPYKDKLISIIEDGIGFGVSTRGTGSTRPYKGPLGEGLEEVVKGYALRAIDIVHDPSADAFPNIVKEETQNIFTVPTNFKSVWEEVFKSSKK